MLTRSPQFDAAIVAGAPVVVTATIQSPPQSDVNGQPIPAATLLNLDLMPGASIHLDDTAESRRTFTGQVADDGTLAPHLPTDPLAPFGNELVVSTGLVLPEPTPFSVPYASPQGVQGNLESLQLGVFRLQTVTDDSTGLISFTLAPDRAAVVAANLFETPYTIAAGTSLDKAIGGILALTFPQLPWIPDGAASGDVIASTTVFLPGTSSGDPWQCCQELALEFGREVFIDANGNAVMREIPDSTQWPISWTYAPGTANMAVSGTHTIDTSQLANVVIITAGGTGVATPVTGSAEITDITSPIYPNPNVFGRRPLYITSSHLTTAVQCQNFAQDVLNQQLGGYDNIQFTAIPHPAHEPSDVVSYTSGLLGMTTLLVLSAWDLQVDLLAPANYTTRSVGAEIETEVQDLLNLPFTGGRLPPVVIGPGPVSGIRFVTSTGVTRLKVPGLTTAISGLTHILGGGGGGGGAPTLPSDAVVGTPAWRMICWGGSSWASQSSTTYNTWYNRGWGGWQVTLNSMYGYGGSYDFKATSASGSGSQFSEQQLFEGDLGSGGTGISTATTAGYETYFGFYITGQAGTGDTPSDADNYWPPFGTWWDDTLWGAVAAKLGVMAGAANFLGMTGLSFDVEQSNFQYQTHMFQQISVAGAGSYQITNGNWTTGSLTSGASAATVQAAIIAAYHNNVVVTQPSAGVYAVVFPDWDSPAALSAINQAGVTVTCADYSPAATIAEAHVRGQACAQAMWGAYPGLVLLWYHLYPPGGINDVLEVVNGGTVPHVPFPEDGFFAGMVAGMAAVGATGRIVLNDASFYRDGGNVPGANNQAAYFLNSQNSRASWSTPSLTYMTQAEWNFACDHVDITGFTWRGTDGTPGYDNSLPTDGQWAQSVMDARAYSEGPRRVEYLFDSQWPPTPEFPFGAAWAYTDAAMLGVLGGSTGSIPAASQTPLATSVPTLTGIVANITGGIVTISCTATHAYGIRCVKVYNGTTFSAGNPPASYIGAMNMTFEANGGSWLTNYNSANQACSFSTAGSPGQWFVLEGISIKDDTHWAAIQAPGGATSVHSTIPGKSRIKTIETNGIAGVTHIFPLGGRSTTIPGKTRIKVVGLTSTIAGKTHINSSSGTTPSIAQSVGLTESSDASSISSAAITTTAGNGFLIGVYLRAGSAVTVSSVTDGAGNSWSNVTTPAVTGSTLSRIEVWGTTATPTHLSSQTVTVNFSGSTSAVARFFEIASGHNAGLIDQSILATNGAGTAATSGSTSALAHANELAIGIVAGNSNVGNSGTESFTQGAPATNYAHLESPAGNDLGMDAGTLQITTTTAQAFSATLDFGSAWAAAVIVLNLGP